MAGFKRGGFRGGGGGAYKKGNAKKRAGSDDEDSAPRTSKKSRGDEDEEADSTPVVPEIKTDDDGNKYCPLKTNGMRRVTVSDFNGNTFVNIREYYKTDGGDLKPAKKGISLNIDQYNALLASIPLIESILAEKEVEVVRPDYEANLNATATTSKDTAESGGVQEAGSKVDDDEDEE
ncbi:transcriptional Coactivator p15-domain-containing protein [Paraphoma chrysanthemicola]|uniref:Transcriptional Coactivator p15-domain-containing protein n=1 Tax=Paraphoma chrysanthemicola TaxID=798071 RepID=A0A8K0RAH5_9PLEO|nr:transcriptional Coactivator p15-domain-containing protein [Paraphoma chrysanthemicola]